MSYLPFVAFVSVFLVILFGSHFLVLRFFFGVFALTGTYWKYAAVILSFVLLASFFFASFLAHSYENAFTRSLYLLVGVWLGTFVNLLLAALAVWLIMLVARFIGFELNASVLGTGMLLIALAVSGYGVWNAFYPTVRYTTVTLPNLPAEWKGKTIVQLSDVHLGHIYRSGYLQGVVDRVNGIHPEAVVITGDLFDGMDGNLSGLAAPLGSLRSTHGTYFVTGNHETYLGVDRALSVLEGSGVRVLDDEVVDVGALALVGISYPERGIHKDIPKLLGTLHPLFSGKASILLYHSPSAIPEIAETGIGLQLSGHTHRGQQFPFMFVTHLVHKGFDYGLYHIGDYSLYTSSGVGTWGPPMRVGTRSEIAAITLE